MEKEWSHRANATTKGKANEQTGASKEMKTNATSDALNAEAKGARETAGGRLNEKLRRETTAMLRMQMQEHSEGVALNPLNTQRCTGYSRT